MKKKLVTELWLCMNDQKWGELERFFTPDATIYWPNTREKFTVEDFILANSRYPGDWKIDIQRLEETGNTVISVVKVSMADAEVSFHAVSFFEFSEVRQRIQRAYEYWGEDGEPPEWRKKLGIGSLME